MFPSVAVMRGRTAMFRLGQDVRQVRHWERLDVPLLSVLAVRRLVAYQTWLRGADLAGAKNSVINYFQLRAFLVVRKYDARQR